MRRLIRAARVLTPHGFVIPGEVLVDGKEIIAVGQKLEVADVESVDLGSVTLIPGMIDVHNHGAMGVWVGEDNEALNKVAEYLPATGTTGWLPTVGSADAAANVSSAYRSRGVSHKGAQILGIHMEGPFLAPKNLPGEVPKELPLADLSLLSQIVEAGEGLVKIVGVSPELPGAQEFIRELRRRGIRAAVAHTKCSYEQFLGAVEAGLNHVTHSFNVMTGLHHRRPGAVGGILTEDGLMCELISDGYHVHPAAMKVLVKCKGPANICMITDNVHLAGMPDGTYGEAIKKDGTIRKAGYSEDVDGTMYGSAWPMNHNLSVLVNQVGVSLTDAVKMASTTPAHALGLTNKGSIEPGKDADLVAISSSFDVRWTMVEGRIAFSCSGD